MKNTYVIISNGISYTCLWLKPKQDVEQAPVITVLELELSFPWAMGYWNNNQKTNGQ